MLGIDYAMNGLAVFSDGSRCDYPKYYRKAEQRLAREQRKLSHCQKGSGNYRKQRHRVALCHEKVRNQRKDFQHKLSFRLAEQYDAVAVEDLDMKAMSRCLHLGKGVMDNGYGIFRNLLEYKLRERGKLLIKVDRFYPSSKTCSVCGKVKKNFPYPSGSIAVAAGMRWTGISTRRSISGRKEYERYAHSCAERIARIRAERTAGRAGIACGYLACQGY